MIYAGLFHLMRRGTAERDHTHGLQHVNSPRLRMMGQENAVEVQWGNDLLLDREAVARVQVRVVGGLLLEVLQCVARVAAEAGVLIPKSMELDPWEIDRLANEWNPPAAFCTLRPCVIRDII